MKPVQKPISNKPTSCNEVSSTCVTWDGPALSFACMNIEICKGDSINVALYELFKMMCVALEKTDISLIDSTCLFDLPSEPNTLEELLNLIIRKLCDQDVRVISLEDIENRTYSAILPYCLQNISDTLTVTKLPLDEYFNKVAFNICLQLDQISNLQDSVAAIQPELANISSEIQGICEPITGLEVTPICSGPAVPTPIDTALEALEAAFCSYKNFTGTPQELKDAIAKDCPNINNLLALSNTGTMSQIYGWINNPSTVADSMNNLWLTLCDMRSAIRNTLVGCCELSPCLSFKVWYTLQIDPSPQPQFINVVFNDGTVPVPPTMPGLNGPRSQIRDYTNFFAAYNGLVAPPAWIATNFPTIGNVFITLNDGSGDFTVDTGLTFVDLIYFAGPSGGLYTFNLPSGFNMNSPVKTIKIEFDYKWNNPLTSPDTNCDTCECCCTFSITNGIY